MSDWTTSDLVLGKVRRSPAPPVTESGDDEEILQNLLRSAGVSSTPRHDDDPARERVTVDTSTALTHHLTGSPTAASGDTEETIAPKREAEAPPETAGRVLTREEHAEIKRIFHDQYELDRYLERGFEHDHTFYRRRMLLDVSAEPLVLAKQLTYGVVDTISLDGRPFSVIPRAVDGHVQLVTTLEDTEFVWVPRNIHILAYQFAEFFDSTAADTSLVKIPDSLREPLVSVLVETAQGLEEL